MRMPNASLSDSAKSNVKTETADSSTKTTAKRAKRVTKSAQLATSDAPTLTVTPPKQSKAKNPNSRQKKPTTDPISPADKVADILETEYRGVSLYTVALLLLIVAILWTGVKVVQQIQSYHHTYGELSGLKRDFRQLQIERQRMLIEQQTFSATPQVTNRAVAELNMFYPNLSDRMIIHANKTVSVPKDHDNLSTPRATDDDADIVTSQTIDPETQH